MKSTTAFPAAAYYFAGLFLLIITGLWPSYFVKFVDRTASFFIVFSFSCSHDGTLVAAADHLANINQERKIALAPAIVRCFTINVNKRF